MQVLFRTARFRRAGRGPGSAAGPGRPDGAHARAVAGVQPGRGPGRRRRPPVASVRGLNLAAHGLRVVRPAAGEERSPDRRTLLRAGIAPDRDPSPTHQATYAVVVLNQDGQAVETVVEFNSEAEADMYAELAPDITEWWVTPLRRRPPAT